MKVASLVWFFCAMIPAYAGTVSVTDPFHANGSPDVIGNPLQFDGQSVQVTAGDGKLTVDVFTNYGNSSLYSIYDTGVRLNIGDLFFTVNGVYRYGVPLAYHNGPAGGPWGDRLLAGHIYEIEDPSALLTARQTLHDPQYFDYRPDTIVWMLDLGGVRDVTRSAPSVQVLPIAGNNGNNGPLYDIRIQTSLPAGLFSSPTDTYGLEFAVTTGGNDVIEGNLAFGGAPTQLRSLAGEAVPEPSTYYLVTGTLLVGLARLAWRRIASMP
jgi:hypothetical protein